MLEEGAGPGVKEVPSVSQPQKTAKPPSAIGDAWLGVGARVKRPRRRYTLDLRALGSLGQTQACSEGGPGRPGRG